MRSFHAAVHPCLARVLTEKTLQLLARPNDCCSAVLRVWNVKKCSNSEIKILPHPNFIYTAKFHPRVPKIIATGGYDRTIRLWTAAGDDVHALVRYCHQINKSSNIVFNFILC